MPPPPTPSAAAVVARWLCALAAVVLVAACTPGAASTTGCEAFLAWEERGFPRDLSSATAGPTYLTFLATVADEAAPVAAEAQAVLTASQTVHEAWLAAGGPDGPATETERAAATEQRLLTPELGDAAARVDAYGEETCGIAIP